VLARSPDKLNECGRRYFRGARLAVTDLIGLRWVSTRIVYGERMKKLKIIQMPYWPDCTCQGCYGSCETGRHETLDQRETLLLKEIDETNNWARTGFQLYFGSFTLLLTVNVLSAGWLFTRTGGMPRFTFLLFFVFIGLNLMGTIMTYRIRREMLYSDDRIACIIDSLAPDVATDDINSRPLSPMPREACNIAFFFAGATSFMLLVFWTVLVVWGFTAGFFSLGVGSN